MNLNIKTYKFEKYQKLKISIDIIIKFRSNSRRIIRNKINIIIILDAITTISIVYNDKKFQNRDFLFKFDCFQDLDIIKTVFIYVVDFSVFII